MDTCKSCLHYTADPGKTKGSCTIMGDDELIKNDSTITDWSEDDKQPYHLDVGENFGCIHWEDSFI